MSASKARGHRPEKGRPWANPRSSVVYTGRMRSVADDLRLETRGDVAWRTPAERVELAFRLGEDDVALLCAARGVSRDEAKHIIARSRAVGRRPSVLARGDSV